ncbi:hypothetical protein C8F01DRAFT_761395 [Mycena amicta]|nr:hypothetical protein C8F01DRAFT_761395 [Mycena amicta]
MSGAPRGRVAGAIDEVAGISERRGHFPRHFGAFCGGTVASREDLLSMQRRCEGVCEAPGTVLLLVGATLVLRGKRRRISGLWCRHILVSPSMAQTIVANSMPVPPPTIRFIRVPPSRLILLRHPSPWRCPHPADASRSPMHLHLMFCVRPSQTLGTIARRSSMDGVLLFAEIGKRRRDAYLPIPARFVSPVCAAAARRSSTRGSRHRTRVECRETSYERRVVFSHQPQRLNSTPTHKATIHSRVLLAFASTTPTTYPVSVQPVV